MENKKNILMNQIINHIFSLKQGNAAKRKTRSGWTILFLFLTLLSFNQKVCAKVNCPEPLIKNLHNFAYPDSAHLSFDLYFFNYDGKNSGFSIAPWITINEKTALFLDDIYPEIWNNFNSEDDVRKHKNPGYVGSKDFNTGVYKGKVVISNIREESSKWFAITIDIILDTIHYGDNLTFALGGKWKNHNGTATDVNIKKTVRFPDNISYPTFRAFRTDSNTVEIYSTNLQDQTFLYQNGDKNTKGHWTYGLRFSNIDNPNVNSPSNLILIKKFWQTNINNSSNVNAYNYECPAGTKEAHATLQLSNYKAHFIHPFISRTANGYTIFPNNKDRAVKDTVNFCRNYDGIWINGYPRPVNTTTSYNMWTRYVTIEWDKEIFDKSHVTTKGKWRILRRTKETSGYTDYTSISTITYSDKTSHYKYEDKTDKEFNTEYEYCVIFQPDEWNRQLASPDGVEDISAFATCTVEPSTPLQGISATRNLANKIEITCSYHSFENASATNSYELKLYRRVNGEKEWGTDYYKNHKITKSNETSYTFVDTDVYTPCTVYEYKAEVDAFAKTYTIEGFDAIGQINSQTAVTSLTASCGTYSNAIRLTWNVNQVGTKPTTFKLKRRTLGTNENYTSIYTTSGTSSVYSFEDITAAAGTYYEYNVEWTYSCDDNPATRGNISTDGFALATGIVSGRISYDTGTSAEGVKVTIEANDNESGTKPMLCAFKKNNNGASNITLTSKEEQTLGLYSNPWTLQMYLLVDSLPGNNYFYDTKWHKLYINNNGNVCASLPVTDSSGNLSYEEKTSSAVITPDAFYNVSMAYEGNGKYIIRVIDKAGEMQVDTLKSQTGTLGYTKTHNKGDSLFVFGNIDASRTKQNGIIDECRIWNKALSVKQLTGNYYRILSGSESGLYLYYKFDEGIENPSKAYNYSKNNAGTNGNHAKITNMSSTNKIPASNQLNICGVTDENGNYTISGIPFSGDGISYTIRPILGVHEFQPSKVNRYVSTQSMVHNAVDFEDVSSFPVSGIVYYYGTDIPVEGVQFTVDGALCTKDGSFITTDSEGKFTISVPIGSHYITASKDGHVLTNAKSQSYKNKGYYPGIITNENDTVINNEDFVSEKNNLTFYDQTLVPIAGRIAGGSQEYDKPLGFSLSDCNIGQAKLTLQYNDHKFNVVQVQNGASTSFQEATDKRYFDTPDSTDCKSVTYVNGKGGDVRSIIIMTDTITGEFAAMVPPLKYTVDVEIPSNKNISFNDGQTIDVIDASNPQVTYQDSTEVNEGKWQKFTYVEQFKKKYLCTPKLEITQNGNGYGAFGDSICKVITQTNDTIQLRLYRKDGDYSKSLKNGNSDYTLQYPIFTQQCEYDFNVNLYEEYVNYDRDHENGEKTIIPISGTTVTFNNQMGVGNSVYINVKKGEDGEYISGDKDGELIEAAINEIELDSLGSGAYTWQAGLPNINYPYIYTITASFDYEGKLYTWGGEEFKGIVLGDVTTGNDFVTAGPDEVFFVLRDPPGSASKAYIEQGQTITKTKMRGGQAIFKDDFSTTVRVGFKNSSLFAKNDPVTGIITGTIGSVESRYDLKIGVSVDEKHTWENTNIQTTTTTKRISTNDGSDYVGAVGDVFVGSSTNYTIGGAREVNIEMASKDDEPKIGKRNITTVGISYSTEFIYTQHKIEKELIPQFVALRNQQFQHTTKDGKYEIVPMPDGYKNNTDKPVYFSKLSADHPNFGTSNYDKDVWGKDATSEIDGPSYTMVLPQAAYDADGKIKYGYHAVDTIMWFNEQVKSWQQQLANNEKAKVMAIENTSDYPRTNYSFDSGSSLSASSKTTKTKDHTETNTFSILAVACYTKGFEGFGNGVIIQNILQAGGGGLEKDGTTTSNTTEYGYTLAETGNRDALSVDVIEAPDDFGPIFYTRAGRTCCPYEDEVTTKYYRKGTVIQQKTMQIDMPHLSTDATTISGVPSGKPATFSITLCNNSETEQDNWYNLNVVDSSNPDGASFTMDGRVINGGTTVLVPAGKPVTKTIQIKQTNQDVYDYRGLMLRMSSVCQSDNLGVFPEIADTLVLNVQFQQTGSSIAMEAAETTLNAMSDTTLHLTIYDYDINSKGLYSVCLQAKLEGDPKWVDQKEWLVDSEEAERDHKAVLDGKGRFDFNLDMGNKDEFPDGVWNVRAVTVSYFGDNRVTNTSETLTIYKDVLRPQPISTPSPATGVLTADGEIAVSFNEDIRYQSLSDAANFIVTGELNDAKIAHSVSMNLTGGEGAKTTSGIDLDGKSFSISMWVRYDKPGTLFAHGTSDNGINVSSDDDNRLTVSINDNVLKSAKRLQKDKWMFINFSYDATAETVSASYAYDAFEVTLFDEEKAGKYSGVGALTLGKGLTGRMHEVSLWNHVRPWSTALEERNERKTRYSEGIIGYWRLDEGRGTTAADYARNRTLTLPSATSWHLENKNYALPLDGATVMAADVSAIVTGKNDSYTLELWFRADSEQKDTTNIVGFHNMDRLDIYLDSIGRMNITANGKDFMVSDIGLYDNQWHHLAVNILKSSSGSATFYIDGEARKTMPAADIPALQTSMLIFGGRYTGLDTNATSPKPMYDRIFKGAIDEVRIWHGRRNADVIRNRMYSRVADDADGLVAYFPFEKPGLDGGLQMVFEPTMKNQVKKREGETIEEVIRLQGTETPTPHDSNTAPLKTAPVLQNVAYDFTGSDRKILINLTEQPQRLENSTVTITVRDVMDAHKNTCETITWDVYVRQNRLLWEEQEVSVDKLGTENVSFEAGIVNNSGSTETFAITNLPAWLSVNIESGSLPAISERRLKFTVDPALAVGSHEAIVMLTGSLGISEPLIVKVNSTNKAPDWTVNVNDYESSMNINGQLKVNGIISNDKNDMVAAFRDGRCVGVASPAYYSRYDAYYVLMNVYGNSEDHGKDLTYKVFDASTGMVFPIVDTSCKDALMFASNSMIGTMAQPNVWSTDEEVEQTLDMKKGWQWTSFYVNPVDSKVDSVYAPVMKNLSEIVAENSQWTSTSGSLTNVRAGTMYKVKLIEDDTLDVTGRLIDIANTAVTIEPQWNWIGYFAPGYISLNDAFAELAPQNGDVVKGHSAFATWNDSEWLGTLVALKGGEGYQYYSSRDVETEFHYPTTTATGSVYQKAKALTKVDGEMEEQQRTACAYSGNMLVIASVLDFNGMERNDVEIRVTDDDNSLRAFSGKPVNGRHFLTIAGEGRGATLRFVVRIDGMDYVVPGVMFYNDDAIVGSYSEPLLIDLSSATGIGGITAFTDDNGYTYNLAGQRIDTVMKQQVVIRGGKKVIK